MISQIKSNHDKKGIVMELDDNRAEFRAYDDQCYYNTQAFENRSPQNRIWYIVSIERGTLVTADTHSV